LDPAANSKWAYEEHKTFDDMARDEGKSDGASITCIAVDTATVSKLIESVGPYNFSDERAAQIRSALSHPPYKAIRARYYESQEYFIVLDPNHVLDLWLEEANNQIYNLARQR
jgi:hypothetical protein